MVNFRVTEEEFDRLKRASQINGSRSVSEFARARVLASYSAEAEKWGRILERLGGIEKRLSELSSHVQELGKALAEMRSARLTVVEESERIKENPR